MNINSSVIAIITHCKTCGAEVELSPNAMAYSARGVLCKDCMRNPPKSKWTPQLYAEYLQTEHWKAKRGEALRLAGDKCQVCASVERLEVHHNDYARLGGELRTDLVVLCSVCHSLFHGV